MDENNRIILRTYKNAWQFEKKIYTVGDITLPFAINITQLGWFGLGLIIMIMITKVLPFLSYLPSPILYAVCPFVIMKLLTRVKFHGKPTVAWIKGFFRHLISPAQLERFQTIEEDRKAAFTNVVFRH